MLSAAPPQYSTDKPSLMIAFLFLEFRKLNLGFLMLSAVPSPYSDKKAAKLLAAFSFALDLIFH